MFDCVNYFPTSSFFYILFGRSNTWSGFVVLQRASANGILVSVCRFVSLCLVRTFEPDDSYWINVSLSVTDLALRRESIWGSGCIDRHFLDLCTRWRWVVSFTPRSLYPRWKSSRNTLYMRLGAPQIRSGRRGEGKILDPSGFRTPIPQSSSP
jgi:hypothetical protein